MAKTTLNLDDELLAAAKRFATARGTTLRAVVEEGLRLVLAAPAQSQPFKLRLPIVNGVGPPATDVADRDALYAVMQDPTR